jgi:undecaprenyl-diphosphatase
VEQLAKRASLLLLVLLVLGGLLALAARWVARHPDRVHAVVDRQLHRPVVARLRERYQRQLVFLARRLRPGGALGLSLTITIVALVGAAWAFGAVLQDVLARDDLALVDQPVMRFIVARREAWLTSVMRLVTDLGSAAVLVPLVVVVGLGWRWRTGSWRALVLLTGALAGARVLQETVKLLVARPRPPITDALIHAGGLGFPSEHATDAAATYGTLAALLAGTTTRWPRKVAIWAAAVGLAGLIGLSRLYLGCTGSPTRSAALGSVAPGCSACWSPSARCSSCTPTECRRRTRTPPSRPTRPR